MEKEHSDGIGSLFLLFLAILALICYMELGRANRLAASTSENQAELLHVSSSPSSPASVKATVSQGLDF
ncbi:hypothetical protein GCM10027443_27330 [Pontibacter brevis]